MASPNKFSYFRGKPSKLAVIQRCPGPTGKHSGPEFDHDPLPLIRHLSFIYRQGLTAMPVRADKLERSRGYPDPHTPNS